jgi:hypothetical protein
LKGLYIYDTESDGLAGKSISPENHMTHFHVMLFKQYAKNDWVIFLDHSHPEFEEAKKFVEGKNVNLRIKDLSTFPEWVENDQAISAIGCQNQFGFDLLAIANQFGMKASMFPESIGSRKLRLFDTLSMSRALYPDRPVPHGCPAKVKNPNGGKAKTIGAHSLEAWGYKLANQKVKIEDWKGLPLWKYCDRVWEDVIINELQWQALIKESQDGKDKGVDWRLPLKRNSQADYLMQVQEEQGVVFNEDKAWKLLGRIDKMMSELEEEVEPNLPMKDVPESRQPNFPANPFDKQGNISSHGWNYAKKYLGFVPNEEYFKHVDPPKTAFKKDGSLSKNGYNYCVKMGVESEESMPEFIRNQLTKSNQLSPLPEKELGELRKLLEEKFVPPEFLKEPMTLSNQADIKEWLVKEGGWVPTLMGTKDITRDDNKKNLPEFEVLEKAWEWVCEKRSSIYVKYINDEMGFDIRKITSENHKDMQKVVKKGRFLPMSPKLKNERGELCPNLEKINGDMASKIVKWLSLRNRRSVIKAFDEDKTTGWLNHPRLKLDGKLPARYSGLTNTNRRKHSVIANIPSTDALLGHEMRELFTVPEGFWQLGIDGSNLEGFCAANAAFPFDGGAYYKSLSGDPHTANAAAYSVAAGRTVTRQEGKGITYGVLYGAQAAKVASMLGISKDQAQAVIDAFWDTNAGLKGCKEYLEKFWESTGKKYILGIDGRKIWTRSKHSLLNAYLQSMGAIGMDLAGILWHERALEEGLLDKGVARTIYYHDEYQLQCPDGLVRWKRFDTGFSDPTLVTRILGDVDKSKKAKSKGKPYKTAKEMLEEYGISMEELKGIIKARENAENLDGGKFKLSGNTRVLEDGSIGRCYCRVGELMVQCIEDAYKQLDFHVPITGEYLIGTDWASCH